VLDLGKEFSKIKIELDRLVRKVDDLIFKVLVDEEIDNDNKNV